MRLTNIRKITSGLLFAFTIMAAAVIGFSQQGPGPGRGDHGGWHGGFGRFGASLNLTEAQKTQMAQIAARFEESTKATREQLRNLHQSESSSFKDGAFDEAAVRAQAQARANLEVELEVARARMMSEMYAVLTPEQKAQLAQQRQQHEQRHKQGSAPNNEQ